jgi:putative DNA primase/helicase
MTIDTALLDAALAYARAGLPVFPCKLDKTPHIKDWGNAASAVESQIREWWKRWPDASIGMLTGYLTGRLVIDSDPRHHGDKSLGIMEELHGPLPDTLEVRTGGGGRHLYFQLRGLNIHNSAGDLAPGVDVRGVGGYVVLPPSPHPSGNRYEWVNENPISDLPEWLEKWLLELKPAPSLGTNGAGKKIATGKRNNWLTKRAGGYRRHGDTPEVIFQKLMMDNAERCEPPMSEREVRTIANSVARYAPAEEPSRPSKANIPQDPFPSSTPPPSSPEQPEQEDVPGRLPIVEVANAERLVARYGEEIRYASDRKVWVAWNGTHWDVNDEMGLSRRMQDVARSIYSEAANSPAEELRKALASWARKSESHSVQSGSIAEARNKVEVRRFGKVFDTHPHLLNVRNCTHDLLTGESHPHSRLDFLTKIVETNYQLGAECPQFSKFLAETFHGSVPLMDYAMRLAGYFLSGLTGEHKWWIF